MPCSCFEGPQALLRSYEKKETRVILKDRSGQRPEDCYDLDPKPLGAGAFGTVRRVWRKRTGQELVMKTMEKDDINNEVSFRNEVKIQCDLDHPNIVRIFDLFEDKTTVSIVMEFMKGGELADFLTETGRLADTEARAAMWQVLSAVSYMHHRGIAHRDLKPENFLVEAKGKPLAECLVKLADFGFSQAFTPGEATLKTKCGTAYYFAPEILDGPYTEKCDCWSCGVILHLLLCGYPPFQGETDEEIIAKADKAVFDFKKPAWEGVLPTAVLLVVQLCKRDPTKRVSAGQALDSPWFAPMAQAKRLETSQQQSVLKRLQSFKAASKFEQAALHLTARSLDSAQLTDLRERFLAMDKDKTGTLTIDELKESLAGAKGDWGPGELEQIFAIADSNGSNELDWSEFLAVMVKANKETQREALWNAFRIFDKDNSGTICKKEIALVLSDLKLSKEEIQQALIAADADGDGLINFEEFMQLMGHRGE